MGRRGEHRARIILCSHWPCRTGIRNLPWQVPASSSPHGERHTSGRGGFLVGQDLAVVGLGQVRRDHLEQPSSQHRQGSGVVVPGEVDQVLFGVGALLRCDRELAGAGQPVQRCGDHPGLREVRCSGVHRTVEGLVALQGLGKSEVRAGAGPGLAGLDRRPVRRGRGGPHVAGAGALGLGQHPQPQRRELDLGPGQLDQRLALLRRGHRPDRGGSDPVHAVGQLLGEPQQRASGLDRFGRDSATLTGPSTTTAMERCGSAGLPHLTLREHTYECNGDGTAGTVNPRTTANRRTGGSRPSARRPGPRASRAGSRCSPSPAR